MNKNNTIKTDDEVAKDKNFVKEIMNDVTGINLSTQENQKLSVFLRYETGNNHLFTYINEIYKIIGANFKKPEKVIIIPFNDETGRPHLNIQRIG